MRSCLIVQGSVIVEVEDRGPDASRLPRGQRVPAGHHALNRCATQRQINIRNPPLRSSDLSKSITFPTRAPPPSPPPHIRQSRWDGEASRRIMSAGREEGPNSNQEVQLAVLTWASRLRPKPEDGRG